MIPKWLLVLLLVFGGVLLGGGLGYFAKVNGSTGTFFGMWSGAFCATLSFLVVGLYLYNQEEKRRSQHDSIKKFLDQK